MYSLHVAGPLALWAAPLLAGAAFLAGDQVRARRWRIQERLIEAREREMGEIARALIAASRESPDAVCAVLDRSARRLCPAVDTVIFSEREEDALRCTYATGTRAEYFQGLRLQLEHDASPLALAALRCHRVASRGLQRPLVPGDRSFLALPMVENAKSIGVLYLASASTDCLPNEESIVTLVDLGVSAYQLAQERCKDRERATIDALTELFTPGAFRSLLCDTIAQHANASEACLALLFIDTDEFKACNDTLGHAAGDSILRTLARIFVESAGPESIVARNGGDEFCILFSITNKMEAVRRAQAIRRAVEAYPFHVVLGDRQPPRRITTSIGVSIFPTDATAAPTLLATADRAMYYSKEHGRNRVSFYDAAGLLAEG